MKTLFCTLVLVLGLHSLSTQSCTRVMYAGKDGVVITARTMDWSTEMKTDIWIFPRGIARTGEVGENSIRWTSKYGSVATSSFDITTSDGVNEKGLVANMLWLTESKYETWDGKRDGLSMSLWSQYMLDNFATVQQVVDCMRSGTFVVVTDQMPGQSHEANLHLSVSDASGDSAIFEYIDGKLMVYHGKEYKVLTNSPSYDQQLAITKYWQQIGGLIMLPGTNRAADRFVRASFYVNRMSQEVNNETALASMFSIIRNCSVPYGISTPGEPNISTTQWRSVVDQKNLVYHFEPTMPVSGFWVDLKKIDFDEKASIKRLDLPSGKVFTADVTAEFTPAIPFKFLGI